MQIRQIFGPSDTDEHVVTLTPVPGTNFGDLPGVVHLRATRKSTLGNERTFRGQQFIGQRAIVRVTNYHRTPHVGPSDLLGTHRGRTRVSGRCRKFFAN